VDLEGHERVLYRVPGALKVQDVAKDGRILLVHELIRAGILGHVPGEEGERELGWLDWSIHRALSRDGQWLLFDESGDAPHGDSWLFLRRTDGSAPEKLGSGSYADLSPDGQWVAAVPSDFRGQVNLLPTGSGQPRSISLPSLKAYGVAWFPDGKHVALAASEAGKGTRIYVVDVESGAPRPISPEGSATRIRGAVSPDGKFVAGRAADGETYLFPVSGGAAQKVEGLREGESVLGWSADAQSVYVGALGETTNDIYLVNLATGHRQPFRTLSPADKAGLTYVALPTFTSDGRYYVYSYNRQISELFVAEGVR
jgi:eukaryotic-like serine/threonine-protein kinase